VLVKVPWLNNLVMLTLRADTYFMVDGEYKFDPTKLRTAHEWCQAQVELAMIQNHVTYGLDSSDIVVSNTFTQEWEMKHYYALADQLMVTECSVSLWRIDMVVLTNTEYLKISYKL
jgi:hypothetical protein